MNNIKRLGILGQVDGWNAIMGNTYSSKGIIPYTAR